ncbi:hypothetical protein Ct61P_08405 [Colletotrichum tofieldiae]|nr:hypothetical protein Ct61P_08405 [Colletotrichum tofieldiae]
MRGGGDWLYGPRLEAVSEGAKGGGSKAAKRKALVLVWVAVVRKGRLVSSGLMHDVAIPVRR